MFAFPPVERTTLLAVEIALLAMASALVLSVYPPISYYVSSYISRILSSAAGGMIQILNTEFREGIVIIDVKNMGPGDLEIRSLSDFQVYVDNKPAVVKAVVGGPWQAGTTIRVIAETDRSPHERHIVVLYGPGGTQAMYLYYPFG